MSTPTRAPTERRARAGPAGTSPGGVTIVLGERGATTRRTRLMPIGRSRSSSSAPAGAAGGAGGSGWMRSTRARLGFAALTATGRAALGRALGAGRRSDGRAARPAPRAAPLRPGSAGGAAAARRARSGAGRGRRAAGGAGLGGRWRARAHGDRRAAATDSTVVAGGGRRGRALRAARPPSLALDAVALALLGRAARARPGRLGGCGSCGHGIRRQRYPSCRRLARREPVLEQVRRGARVLRRARSPGSRLASAS